MRRSAALSSFALALASLVAPAGLTASLAAPSAACNGIPATISSSAAVITGTPSRDVIVATGPGAHAISAGAGDDVICGSPGADRIDAGSGDDTVTGGAGNDTISGGTGSDTLSGGAGNDKVTGGAGSDTVAGGAGSDTLSGGVGDDTITGGAGNDAGAGDAGADAVKGDTGNDALSGGAGNDTLSGGPGTDTLAPGTGQDYCPRDARDTITGTCTIDASGPTIAASMATSNVQAGSTATFMWQVNDTSGVQLTWAKIAGPYGWITEWCGWPIMGERASGTAQSGLYAASCQIPADAVNATYTVLFSATDAFGQPSGEAWALFTVTGGSTDNSPPVVSDVTASPSTVKIGEPLTVTWRATDETGVTGVIAWAFCGGFGDNLGRLIVDETSLSPALVSGDEKDGTYQQSITLNQFAPRGECSIWISARDRGGNKSFFQTPATFVAS